MIYFCLYAQLMDYIDLQHTYTTVASALVVSSLLADWTVINYCNCVKPCF